jgi:hypothetical protein
MKLLLINKNNQVLDLYNSRSKWVVKAVEGLHGIETDIVETESPYVDGSETDHVKALPRGIEITLKLKGNVQESIDYFTSIVKSKQYVTLREVDEKRDITIRGIVTIPPYTRMMRSCEIVFTVYCGKPYWEDIEYVVNTISQEVALLQFPEDGLYFPEDGIPFSVYDLSLEQVFTNNGDVSVGMLIGLVAIGDVKNPRISCSSGDQKGWYMQVNITLKADDELKINTEKGNKYITINGLETYNGDPILNYLEFVGYDWLQLEQGDNVFNVTAESGAEYIHLDIVYKGRYE